MCGEAKTLQLNRFFKDSVFAQIYPKDETDTVEILYGSIKIERQMFEKLFNFFSNFFSRLTLCYDLLAYCRQVTSNIDTNRRIMTKGTGDPDKFMNS